jgi:hypothetical protein
VIGGDDQRTFVMQLIEFREIETTGKTQAQEVEIGPKTIHDHVATPALAEALGQ